MSEVKIMLGNEAIARGAFEAGVKVSAAYPGTPSTEISENIVNYPEIYAEWSPNEKVAMEVAIGASISGVRSMASMKHVGVNVASDPLYTISYSLEIIYLSINLRTGLIKTIIDVTNKNTILQINPASSNAKHFVVMQTVKNITIITAQIHE